MPSLRAKYSKHGRAFTFGVVVTALLPVAAIAAALMQAWVASAQEVVDLNKAGIAAYDSHNYPAAIEQFQAAYALAPDEPTLKVNLCNALQAYADQFARASDFTNAILQAEKAVALAPDNVAPLVQLGSYYLRTDRVSEAVFRLEEAIEVKPGELDAHELLGKAYYEDNDLPSARAQWEYVLKMDPKRTQLKELYEKAFREESVEWDFRKKDSANFKLSYPEGTDYNVRASVLRILEKAYRDIGGQMGKVYPPEPVQVVVYGGEQFTEATQLASHVGAVFDGKIRAPLTDESGGYLDDEELSRRLTHEYVHVIVRQLAGPNVPWWVNEGLAEQLSSPLEPRDVELLREAYANGAAFKLKQMEGDLLGSMSADQLRLAYRQAHATMGYLWRRFGRNRMQAYLGALGKGTNPDEALREVFRRTPEQLDDEVARDFATGM